MRVVLIAALIVVVSLKTQSGATEVRRGGSDKREAYVTLLYGDNLLSVRVLGLSLKLTGTWREMVVLCTDVVSTENHKILEGDGWTVKSIKTTYRLYKNYLERYKHYAKLTVWTLTEYRRIVYLDSDTVVYANIDELFHCGKFCAAYWHSDLFNGGVLVVKPDVLEYRKLISMVGTYPSYDGGQFLNYYYHSLLFAPMFNASKPDDQEEPMRLPAGYNFDVGQYYVYADHTTRFKVLHHTLGSVKPWKWWTYPFFDLNWYWVELRDHLQPSTDSPMGGFLTVAVNFLLVAIITGLSYCQIMRPTWFCILKHDSFAFSMIVALIFPLSCILGFCSVPGSMHPYYAIASFCLWTIFFMDIFVNCVYIFTSTSEVYEFPLPFGVNLICVLLFMSLVVPLFIPSILTRLYVFLILILLCFVSSHHVIERCLALS